MRHFLYLNTLSSDFLVVPFLILTGLVSDFSVVYANQKHDSHSLGRQSMKAEKKRLNRDSKGYFYRNLGWLPGKRDGKPSQPKFILGKEESQSLERLHRLEKLWELVAQHHEEEFADGRPVWTKATLDAGKAISRGEHTCSLPRQNQPGEDEEDRARADADYAGYLTRMQDAYPVITFVPEDAEAFQNGIRKNIALAEESQAQADDYVHDARQPSVRDMRETLHKAIYAFAKAIEQNPKYKTHDKRPGSQPLTAWAYKLKANCLDFLNRYDDRPLSALSSLDSVQSLYDYWRNRPYRKGTKQSISVNTVENRIKALNLFLKWLHRTDQFSWQKPADFDEIDRSVTETKEEQASRARPDQVVTFSEEELVFLYQSTVTPLERILMLLALNCGCKQAEVGTIALGEVFLECPHPYADLIDFKTAPTDSFIKRVRLKSNVYGEFKLWPHTVLGLKWLISRRKHQTRILKGEHANESIAMTTSSVLLTNDNGLPMYRLYSSGNTGQEIPNCWSRLARRMKTAHPMANAHRYSTLRRTTTNFLRKVYDAEVASLFLQHGTPFEKDRLLDDYSNRPYGKLFEALDRWGERLRPMFQSVPDPFSEEENLLETKIPICKINEIRRLFAEGKKKVEIAQITGVHRTTLYRYLE